MIQMNARGSLFTHLGYLADWEERAVDFFSFESGFGSSSVMREDTFVSANASVSDNIFDRDVVFYRWKLKGYPELLDVIVLQLCNLVSLKQPGKTSVDATY